MGTPAGNRRQSDLRLQLCERPTGQGYRGSEVMTIRKGVGITAGDWERGDGRGGHSAFGSSRFFCDENFIGRHSAPGVLSMANSGVHSNGSVFMISLAKLPHLGGWPRRREPGGFLSAARPVS